MTNLLVTLIAIVTMAAAAMVGIHYGGQAYMDARAAATANTLVSQATQIAAAWKGWSKDHGRADLTDYAWGDSNSASDFVPTYLNLLPAPPKNINYSYSDAQYYLAVKGSAVGLFGSGSGQYSAYNPVDTILLGIGTQQSSINLCDKISKLSGDGPYSIATSMGNWMQYASAPFGCVYDDFHGNGIHDAGDGNWFYYKVL